ncbi:MAG TPA: polysaccharide deacetylase family protein [Bacteroidales bacterium]|nr:polysaccharide deacetylase family protein [Bacteroidales bacterium]
MHLLVYTNQLTQRLTYTLDLVLKQLLSIDYQLTTDAAEVAAWDGNLLQYADQRRRDDSVWIRPHSLLFRDDCDEVAIQLADYHGLQVPFAVEGGDLPFDPLAASFFMVSRYEEVIPHITDRLGRFPAHASLAYQLGCLSYPVVHQWAEILAQCLAMQHPGFTYHLPEFAYQPTYDIDVAFAYRGRSWWHTSGTLVRDTLKGRHGLVRERYRVISGRQSDPYDTYEYLQRTLEMHQPEPVFFFLLGNKSEHDHNLSHRARSMQRLIRELSVWGRIGLHPSSLTSGNQARLNLERDRLEQILGRKVDLSRQHFLMLTLPDTYVMLEHAGILHDFSMGYADQCGYRAGVNIPFMYFDLRRNTMGRVCVHPFAVMDGTLNHYLGYRPEEAIEELDHLVGQARRWGGAFTTLWHNSSLSETQEWVGWREVHEHLLGKASSY